MAQQIPVITAQAVGTALSEYELDLAGELGSVIWQSDAIGHQGFGTATALTGLTTLKTKLRSYCSALDSSACSAVRECLNIWLALRFLAVDLRDADIGCLHGVTISSDGLRQTVKDIFLLYVPVYQLGELSDKRDVALTPGKGSFIRVG